MFVGFAIETGYKNRDKVSKFGLKTGAGLARMVCSATQLNWILMSPENVWRQFSAIVMCFSLIS